MSYIAGEFYNPPNERVVRHDDPVFGLKWPLPISAVSDKHKSAPLLQTRHDGLRYEMSLVPRAAQ
jgi:dTDP-4-dehydrorhamnose 3,5-epimerase